MMQSQDANILDLRAPANDTILDEQQLQEKDKQITIMDIIIHAKHMNDGTWKPIFPQNMIRYELIWTHENHGCSTFREQTFNEMRKLYHPSQVTASVSLKTMAKLGLSSKMCRLNFTISMKTGFSPYRNARNISANI